MILVSPAWSIPAKPGIRSAYENIADDNVILNVTPALVGETPIYYNIYIGASQIPATPTLITTVLPISIPPAFGDGGWRYDVRATTGGLTNDLNNLVTAGPNLKLFPASVELTAALSTIDGYVSVDSVLGYPSDGYVLLGPEVIFYSSIVGNNLIIATRGQYGTPISNHLIGSTLELFRGAEAPGQAITAIASCGLTLPKWTDHNRVGLEQARDISDGYTVALSWHRAESPAGFSGTQYNIYHSNFVKSLYLDRPKYITSASNATVAGYRANTQHYFGVRATYNLSSHTFVGMTEESSGLFVWPDPTEITIDFPMQSIGTLLVQDTEGYPISGLLKIGHEVVAYSSKTSASYNVSRRDVFGLGWLEDYPVGSKIELFHGIEDGENYFLRINTTSSLSGIGPLPLVAGDGYWGFEYLQDPDGYRNFAIAPQDENHDIVLEDAANADPFDFCGLRSTDQSALLSGGFCASTEIVPGNTGGGGTYHGNSALGEAGGIDVFEGNLARQEILLSSTGSPFVLLRRRTTGKTCRFVSHRNEHPFARCGYCYGTMFEGGYDRYIHGRRIRPSETNPNGFIALRIEPYSDDIVLTDDRGMSSEKTDLSCWLPAVPTVRVRDVLIRYSFDYETKTYTEEFRYEVLTVNRNQIVLGKDGAQKVALRRLNPTEEIYKYPVFLT